MEDKQRSDVHAGRIVRLRSSNVKRIHAVEVVPDGDGLVVISGANDQGKSSVLDSIRFALGGKTAMKDTPRVVRDGESAAEVVVEFEDLVVKRTVVGDRYSLVVESRDGARFPSPQAMLDTLLGALTFDPLAFAHWSSKQQADTLLALIGVDVDALDAAIAAPFDERTVASRQLTRAEAARDEAFGDGFDDVPEQPVDVAATFAELERARAHNAGRSAAMKREIDLQTEVDAIEDEIDQLRRRQQQLTAEREGLLTMLAEREDYVDVAPLQERISTAETVNARVRERDRWHDLAIDAGLLREAHDRLTAAVDAARAAKAAALSAAPMPVPGLSIADDRTLLFQGVPLSQASESQRVKTSAAIQMALNPSMRVMLIDNGNALDPSNLAVLDEMAREHSMQVWMTYVGDSGRQQVVIVDGEVEA